MGYHEKPDGEDFAFAETPIMNELVEEGVEIDRHYSYPVCTPARCAMHTGRVPMRVQLDNSGPRFANVNDRVHGYQVS